MKNARKKETFFQSLSGFQKNARQDESRNRAAFLMFFNFEKMSSHEEALKQIVKTSSELRLKEEDLLELAAENDRIARGLEEEKCPLSFTTSSHQ